jgi:hypothetical protein
MNASFKSRSGTEAFLAVRYQWQTGSPEMGDLSPVRRRPDSQKCRLNVVHVLLQMAYVYYGPSPSRQASGESGSDFAWWPVADVPASRERFHPGRAYRPTIGRVA